MTALQTIIVYSVFGFICFMCGIVVGAKTQKMQAQQNKIDPKFLEHVDKFLNTNGFAVEEDEE